MNQNEIQKNHLQAVVNFLNNVDINQLQNRIINYRLINKDDMTINEIGQKISEALSFYYYSIFEPIMPKGFNLIRGRKFNSIEDIYNLKFPDSYWEPPKLNVKRYGRINKPNENNLYLTTDYITLIKELNVHEGDLLVISKFICRKPMKMAKILFLFNTERQNQLILQNGLRLNDNGKKASKIYTNFFIELFSGNIDDDLKYKQSNAVTKWFYDYPNTEGWEYGSVQNQYGFNYCIKPKSAHKKLKLDATIVIKINHGMNFNVIAIREPLTSGYIFTHDEHFSKYFQKYFPLLYSNLY